KQWQLNTVVAVGDGAMVINASIEKSDFAISTDPGTSASCWNSDLAGSISTAIQNKISSNLPASLSIKCGNLDYLRISNLLFPGQNVIQLDSTLGLAVPYDFVIFGNFGQSAGATCQVS
ncbi:MAG: hypothetical protein ABL894_04790, partial [Hyphomicrobium sp.]